MYLQRSGSKYHNKSSIYNGSYYASQLEAAFAMELDLRFKAHDIKDWTKQITVPLMVNGMKICNYRVDFRVVNNDDSITWYETKGLWTDVARLKVKLFEAAYLSDRPNERFEIIKKGK